MQDLSHSRDCAFEAFITNLGKYNKGYLVGEWVKFPITNEEMQEVFKRIGINRRYEEWFITDYECPDAHIYDLLGEYESLSELNYLAGKIMELDKSEDFMDCVDYLSGVTSDYGLGYYWIEESGVFTDSGYVRSNGGRFVDIYDGNIKNIPKEYRIQSPNLYVRTLGKTEKDIER